MDIAYQVAKILSIVCFLYYGAGCLFSSAMIGEFERFGLSRFRRFTGALELLGSLGLLLGYAMPALVIAAAAGLALLMILGLAARMRVKDSFVQMLPALLLLLVNLFIILAHPATVGLRSAT